ncbi:MAG: BatD family protein, partial [Ferruginibacter sp.]
NASDIESIQPPSLKKFRVISGPNQESGMSNINGVVKQYISLSFVLQPRQPGTIEIGTATAVVNGRKINSSPVILTVKNARSGNNNAQANNNANPFAGANPFEEERSSNDYSDYILHKNENIVEKINKNMQMRLVTDKTSCYVGEPIVAAYKLYTRLKSDSKLTKNPSFNGFSVIDLQQPSVTGFTQEKLNGKEYNVYTIRKAQLYPLQAGKIELESASLENNLQFIKEESLQPQGATGNLFDDILMPQGETVNQTVTLNSKPITIEVKPLPEVGKPATFTGAVGEFSIDKKTDKTTFTTDETGKLYIVISGAGNLQLINAPEINWPAGIDGFEPTVNDKYSTTSVPLRGDKIFEYSFSTQSPGDYTIPPVSFSFFNPATETYKTVATNAIPLKILKGNVIRYLSGTGVQTGKKNQPDANWFNMKLLIAAMLGLIAFGCIIWFTKRSSRLKQAGKIKLENVSEEMNTFISNATYNQLNPLEKTEACLDSEACFEFYALLNKELKTFLAAKFSLNEYEINSRKIINVMDKSGIDNSTILQLQQLLQDIEWMLYTPFERNEKMNEVYFRAQEIIQSINTSLQHHVIL